MAGELIQWADAEALAVTWLTGKLGSATVGTKVPNPRTAAFVKVVVTGNYEADRAYMGSQLTFECWADTETAAADLAVLVAAWVNALETETVNGAFVRRVIHVGGPVNSPDPDSNGPRYLVTKTIEHRGRTLNEES
jgi:hypothetical protein